MNFEVLFPSVPFWFVTRLMSRCRFSVYYKEQNELYFDIFAIYVSFKCRRSGFGKRLVNAVVITHCKSSYTHGCKCVSNVNRDAERVGSRAQWWMSSTCSLSDSVNGFCDVEASIFFWPRHSRFISAKHAARLMDGDNDTPSICHYFSALTLLETRGFRPATVITIFKNFAIGNF